ncbi:DNA cytosine methyltransferase [Rhizobium ruizarguesonis]|uniref:DNA cytosine methyltransferase n=1 Tax=Rhizobium ruizarguesonis TaxID=2081791 RepID=UPI00102F3856|nr:DNA cytosine methyltransferase [Rhizobium ruizarguesonis]TAV19042.1 DNA cytosine methyltransferase [Rhizobium ruizarguesonis]
MREMARLTFPDDVEIAGSIADAQRRLGNAVPSLFAEVLARAIGAQLLNEPSFDEAPKLSLACAALPSPYRLSPQRFRSGISGSGASTRRTPGDRQGRWSIGALATVVNAA